LPTAIDEYNTIKLIGKGCYSIGAFGNVFQVKNKTTNEIRAMKIISKENVKNIESFSREISTLRKLDHPSIIKIIEYFQDNDNFYIISEYCEGGELFDLIVKEKRLHETLAATIMKQLVSAIAYCHNLNIMHRL